MKKHTSETELVFESRFLEDRITGASREVDICIESNVGGHVVLVSIECIDHKRKADVTWVEKMKAKHERLPTNLLVLCSRNGFTSEAVNVANLYGIQTLSMQRVNSNSVKAILDSIQSFYGGIVTLFPEKVIVRVKQTENLEPETISTFPDNKVYSLDGRYLGILSTFVNKWMRTKEVLEKFASEVREEHIWFYIVLSPVRGDFGDPIYLQKEQPRVLREVDWIRIEGECKFETSKFPLEHGILSGVRVCWGSSEIDGKPAFLVASEDTHGATKVSISFSE